MNYYLCISAALFVCYILSELFIGVVALAVTFIKPYHHLGLRMMAMNIFTSWAVPRFCSCGCDSNCALWTCPNYHK